MKCLLVTTVVALSLLPSVAFAEWDWIGVQGYITDTFGNPISGVHQMIFNIYRLEYGGEPLWSETQAVELENGQFKAYLGKNQTIPSHVFTSYEGRWLQISFDGNALPREPFLGLPHSYTAQLADFATYADTASYARRTAPMMLSDGYYYVSYDFSGAQIGETFFAALTDSGNTVAMHYWGNDCTCTACEWSDALAVPQGGAIVGLRVEGIPRLRVLDGSFTVCWGSPLVLISYADGRTYAARAETWCDEMYGNRCDPPHMWELVNDFGFSLTPPSSPKIEASHR